MLQFLKHISIYTITFLVLSLSVGVNIAKCNKKNKLCKIEKIKTCKEKATFCIKRMQEISCCKQKIQTTCKNKSCEESATIHLQFDFETIIAEINSIEKCKEIKLSKLVNNFITCLDNNKFNTKHLSFSSPPLLNKPKLSDIQVFRL